MSSNVLYRKNKKLLELARKVFGTDVVECAYLLKSVYYYDDKKEYAKYEKAEVAKALSDDSEFDVNSQVLNFDAKNFAIKFKGGNCVEFTSSEWASVTTIDLKGDKTYINS